MNSRRAWLIFSVGAFVYLVAVMQRTSLGISGVAAAERFDSSAAALSSLAVVQLLVYAAMQIPVGVLIDRFGPRALMLAGTALMVAGQLFMAFAPSITLAVVGRILVGAGDAAIFISLIRLISSWFAGPIVPQLSQWAGNIGQLGQVLSAVPLAWVLHTFGWTPAFVSAASVSVLALLLGIIALRDRPAGTPEGHRASSLADAIKHLRGALKRPGTQLGFWSHYVTQSAGTVFTMFWGIPFLVFGLGYSEQTAAAMLLVLVGAGMVAGPIIGILTARFPLRRSTLVLAIVFGIAVAWTAVLLWPGEPPFWLICVLVVVLGIGGPGSLIGLDFARTFNPLRSLGSANGIVNIGGFSAGFVMIFLIGAVLDLLDQARQAAGEPSDLYSADSFRIAFLVQYAVIGFGVVMLLRARGRTRRQMRHEEGIEVAPIWVALSRRWRHRGGH
ncbi:MFS transporter [Microterricola pindariensis]|uniref:MFS transporter n=1 Tax=Microterricola pindariensis TaxID=478010 RepID=A0ABX5AR81_9MICO|nr:MFS transporter [Microterricola pindariensis]PPL14414.1 MFS transporter [Microterricola pindariensis]